MNEYFKYDDSDISAHFSSTDFPDPKSFSMHTHDKCELYYFSEGKGSFKIEGNSYPLKPNDILIMRPNEAHYIEIDGSKKYTRFAIHFDPNLFSKIDPNGVLLQPFFNRESGIGNLYREEMFENMNCKRYIEAMTARCVDRRVGLLANLLPLLNELSAAYHNGHYDDYSDSVSHKIVGYINRHITENITLDSICDEFFISKPQLCRIFKKSTGSTVWNYITVKRIVTAKDMIASGVPPVKAAESCGFNDYSVFYRAYKKQYGSSPSK